jgi:hypothetical protein
MKYIYEIYTPNVLGVLERRDTAARLESSLKQLSERFKYPHGWQIHVSDVLKDNKVVEILKNQDDIDGWSTARERDVWRDASTQEAERKALEEKKAMGWDPFNETETEIHKKPEHLDNTIRCADPIAFAKERNENHKAKVKLMEENDYAEMRNLMACDGLTDSIIKKTLADNNLKTAAAVGKPTLSDVPPVGFFALGSAMADGASKYGRYNWRDTAVTPSVFYDAIGRHLTAWYCGENHAIDSKVHHLGHIMACCAILLDAELYGVLKDDRPKNVKVPVKSNWMG